MELGRVIERARPGGSGLREKSKAAGEGARSTRDQNPHPLGKLRAGSLAKNARRVGHPFDVSYFASAMAWRTLAFAFFRAATAWARVALAATITSATGVRLPEAFRARRADSWFAP